MATGRQGRQDRLNERLRGAQRTVVDDDTFKLDIAGIAQPFGAARTSSTTPPPSRSGGRQSARSSSGGRSSGARNPERGSDDAAQPTQPRRSSRQVPSSPRVIQEEEEVTESPAHAPGSGHRRRVPVNTVPDSTARLRQAVDSDSTNPVSPSPLVQRKRRSDAARARRTRSPVLEEPEPREESQEGSASELEPVAAPPPRQRREEPPARSPSESPDEEPADEISDTEAARQIGRKRPRNSFEPSPELGSEASDNEPPVEPAPKRQAKPKRAPAVQRQPAKRRNPAEGQPKKKKAPKARSARAGSEDDVPIEITVQKFVNADGEEDASDEEGGSEIPFVNKSGETVVDVLAQVCEEVIGKALGQFERVAHDTMDPAKRKASRIQMRAVEAYREEVSARLLQHAIHLNHWHSLRKRLRHVQKQKLELRQEILRLKGEKEQVALRMDAARARSEKENTDAKYRLNASNIMNDVEVAVEQGHEAAQLSDRANKEAELPNLELLISQVSETASSASSSGGLLNQLRDFNAFLERAAHALEST